MPDNSDHDLLVRISTSLEALNKAHEDERERVAVSISRVEGKADAAHMRLDGVVKFQWLCMGGAGVLTLVLTMLQIFGRI